MPGRRPRATGRPAGPRRRRRRGAGSRQLRAGGAAASLGLGVLLLAVAATFDAEPFYATGLALVLLGAGTAAWIGVAGRGATVTRSVGAHRVVEDEPLTVRIDVRAGRVPLPPGRVEEGLLAAPAPVRAGRRRERIRIDVSFARRGRRVLPAPRLVLGDPLGLAQRTVSGGRDDAVLVLPRLFPVRVRPGGGGAAGLAARPRPTAAAEAELDGLRPHAEGAPAARIHWASLAKGGDLMDKRLVAAGDPRPLVILDPRGAAAPEDLDAAVRAAASLTVHFARRGGCGLLLPGDRRAATIGPDLRAWGAAHARLAVLDATAGPALAAAGQRRGVVLFVAARAVDRLPAALGRSAAGGVLVVPGPSGPRPPVLEVAGCHGVLAGRSGAGAALAALGAA